MSAPPVRTAVIGGGWAGMAAAVTAATAGHAVTVFEASRTLGGRARAVDGVLPDGREVRLDNGQHILIGAYTETLAVMRQVGIDCTRSLLRIPLRMEFADGSGLRFPRWPTPLDALAGIASARGWGLADKAALIARSLRWQWQGFRCRPPATVADLCAGLPPRVMADLIEPLCVSALNIAPDRASGQVFLRVLQDALFGASGGSNLLLPRDDLGALFPMAAARWLAQRGAAVRTGLRVTALGCDESGWQVQAEPFDRVVLATSAPDGVHLLGRALPAMPPAHRDMAAAWMAHAQALRHTAIATVYAWGDGAGLRQPMLALRSGPGAGGPAQFVFDRGQLGGPAGLLAFVVSDCQHDRAEVRQQVLRQAREQLAMALQPVQTVVEKRATFACLPGMRRPGAQIAPGLYAAGDHVEGPYPATLESAVRAGVAAIRRS